MTFYDLNMNSKRINNIQDPSANQDVATKIYVDTANTTPIYYPNLRRAGRTGSSIRAYNFDPAYATQNLTTSFMTSITNYPLFYAVYLKAGTIVNGVAVYSASNANQTTTFGRTGGLYSKAGIQLRTSGDVASTISASTVITISFAGYEVPTDDWYYAAVIIYNNSSGGVTLVASPAGAAFAATTTIDSRAQFINYPQITTNATGNLSLFRAATTTSTFLGGAGTRLPNPSISSFGLGLKPLGLQIWLGVY